MLRLILCSILVLMVVQHCSMLVAYRKPKDNSKDALMENFWNYFNGKDLDKEFTLDENMKKLLADYENQLRLKTRSEDFVTQEELDEAVATLTSMIDVLSVQLMSLGSEVDEIKNNRVKRCEVGTRYLDCEWSCCYLDHSEECSFRDYYIFYLQTAFAEPFDEPPLVSVSAVANWKRFINPVPTYTAGFYSSPAKLITNTHFNVTLYFDLYNWSFLQEMYTVSWIACN